VKKNKAILITILLSLITVKNSLANCDIELSSPTVTWDAQTRAEILKNSKNQNNSLIELGKEREVNININCKSSQIFHITFNSQPFDEKSYAFGKEGKMTLLLKNVTIDGTPVDVTDSDNIERNGNSMFFKPGNYLSFKKNGDEVSGINLNAQVVINAFVSKDMTRVNDIVTISNEGHFNIN
jgi:hypothetical protein